MGNLVEGNNNPERSGLVKAAPKADVYTASGTWYCPSGHTRMFIEMFGGGGGSGAHTMTMLGEEAVELAPGDGLELKLLELL